MNEKRAFILIDSLMSIIFELNIIVDEKEQKEYMKNEIGMSEEEYNLINLTLNGRQSPLNNIIEFIKE